MTYYNGKLPLNMTLCLFVIFLTTGRVGAHRGVPGRTGAQFSSSQKKLNTTRFHEQNLKPKKISLILSKNLRNNGKRWRVVEAEESVENPPIKVKFEILKSSIPNPSLRPPIGQVF